LPRRAVRDGAHESGLPDATDASEERGASAAPGDGIEPARELCELGVAAHQRKRKWTASLSGAAQQLVSWPRLHAARMDDSGAEGKGGGAV
jgi:hypothetical protein